MNQPKVTIAIPTYNRAHYLPRAIDNAFRQSYINCTIMVIDDGSTDGSCESLRSYFTHPRFCYVRLGKNVGTAQAKNVAILCSDYDAITFHDSDDIPYEDKVLFQARTMFAGLPNHKAATFLNWPYIGYEYGEDLEIDVVVGAHHVIEENGRTHLVDNRISLLDDFFPNLVFPSRPYEWTHINSGLFRRKVFAELGGFADSIEEDRDLRNRTISSGYLYYYLDVPLIKYVKSAVSLTNPCPKSSNTACASRPNRRMQDRAVAWQRINTFREPLSRAERRRKNRIPINLADITIEMISNPDLFTFNEDIPCTPETAVLLKQQLEAYNQLAKER